MFGAGVGWRKQQEYEIDRTAIDRFVVDGFRQSDEKAIDPFQTVDFAVRDRDTLSETSRSQLFALGNARQDLSRIETKSLGGKVCELLNKNLLAAAWQRRLDRIKVEKI